ncbi:MAG: phage minor tail protein L, partial [Rubrivivax sp.]|nr:phage minor tail protein L [Rubrivivax sp.]
MSIAQALQSLTPSARLVLFVVDGTAIGMPTVLRFHNGTNALSQAVVWQGQTYQYIPVEARGFELRGDGPRPRPSLVVGDVD